MAGLPDHKGVEVCGHGGARTAGSLRRIWPASGPVERADRCGEGRGAVIGNGFIEGRRAERQRGARLRHATAELDPMAASTWLLRLIDDLRAFPMAGLPDHKGVEVCGPGGARTAGSLRRIWPASGPVERADRCGDIGLDQAEQSRQGAGRLAAGAPGRNGAGGGRLGRRPRHIQWVGTGKF
jgi:hypothetical protein